ncbi:hypothetical protein AOLI_G00025710 [Acnodon oligacanthus]
MKSGLHSDLLRVVSARRRWLRSQKATECRILELIPMAENLVVNQPRAVRLKDDNRVGGGDLLHHPLPEAAGWLLFMLMGPPRAQGPPKWPERCGTNSVGLTCCQSLRLIFGGDPRSRRGASVTASQPCAPGLPHANSVHCFRVTAFSVPLNKRPLRGGLFNIYI